jgi:DNA-binding Xre family transcriptional regulator
MAIHIGKIIAQKAKAKSITPTSLGELVNTSPQNIHAIFKRQTIDTGLLLKLCEALNYNFFSEYEKEKAVAGLVSNEMQQLIIKNEALNEKNELLQEKLKVQYQLSEQQNKIITLLERDIKKK